MRNESQLKPYWSGLVLTGKGQPLPSVPGDADVVAKVVVTDKVKVLSTLP